MRWRRDRHRPPQPKPERINRPRRVVRAKDEDMGAYTEYLESGISNDFQRLRQEREKQLKRISDARGGRDVLVIAADLQSSTQAPTSIDYSDLLAVKDQLDFLEGKAVDVILETPGGMGEVVEDIVSLLHGRFDEVAFIIPGWAKSAGTIMAMAGDEILMGPGSALGPIDAQLPWQGRVFSADALIEGFEKIKAEVTETGTLNRAYIPMLQVLSPGELQAAANALKFAQILVTDWLGRYKFKNWAVHSSSGQPVTQEEKQQRAADIAARLCDHRSWLTHGRSIRMPDLAAMGLKITDYSTDPTLNDAITRYYTLLQMTFAGPIYKAFETPKSQIIRVLGAGVDVGIAAFDVECGRCHRKMRVQANLGASQPLQPDHLPFPANNALICPHCGNANDLAPVRQELEAKTGKKIVN